VQVPQRSYLDSSFCGLPGFMGRGATILPINWQGRSSVITQCGSNMLINNE